MTFEDLRKVTNRVIRMVTGLVVGDRTQFELCSPKVAGHVFKFPNGESLPRIFYGSRNTIWHDFHIVAKLVYEFEFSSDRTKGS